MTTASLLVQSILAQASQGPSLPGAPAAAPAAGADAAATGAAAPQAAPEGMIRGLGMARPSHGSPLSCG